MFSWLPVFSHMSESKGKAGTKFSHGKSKCFLGMWSQIVVMSHHSENQVWQLCQMQDGGSPQVSMWVWRQVLKTRKRQEDGEMQMQDGGGLLGQVSMSDSSPRQSCCFDPSSHRGAGIPRMTLLHWEILHWNPLATKIECNTANI